MGIINMVVSYVRDVVWIGSDRNMRGHMVTSNIGMVVVGLRYQDAGDDPFLTNKVFHT